MSVKDRVDLAASKSIFEAMQRHVYQYRYAVTLEVPLLRGGVPSDPKVIEGWIKSKFTGTDTQVAELVAKTMVERGIGEQEATEVVASLKSLNGFKRTQDGQLALQARQIKAGLKEWANICWPKDRWGPSAKGTIGYWAEHVFVRPDGLIPLADLDGKPVVEPSVVTQDFVHVWRGSGIKYTEEVHDAVLKFEIHADFDMPIGLGKNLERSWARVMTVGEQQGIGADRSQMFGRFHVTQFDQI